MIDGYVLYLDRFRGFEDTYIPLADVSFLVGENSSGKTSVLKILKLMANPEFLPSNEFGGEETGLITFPDIVSQEDTSKEFRVGMIRYQTAPNGSRMPLGALISYGSREGLPVDTQLTCTLGAYEVAIKRINGAIYARVRDNAITSETNVRDLLPVWISEQSGNSTDGFVGLSIPEQLKFDSLYYALSILAERLKFAALGRLRSTLFDEGLAWLAPIRTKPKNNYSAPQNYYSPEGTHTPYLIRRVLSTNDATSQRIVKSLQKVGKDSGLFSSVTTQHFGDDPTAPFQLRIILDKHSFNVTNVGYGVSQALPVIVEVICRTEGTWFAIQQPEVHLHPRGQAALGEFLFDFASSENKKFLIETHSDYMIDRYRTKLRRSKKKPTSQVLFFERRNGKNSASSLPIDESGELPEDQPKSYRQFFIKEQMDMLGF